MIDFINWIKSQNDYSECLILRPREWKLKVQCNKPKLKKFSRVLILDCDKCQHLWEVEHTNQQKRPDFLLFLEYEGRFLIVVLEVTKGCVNDDKQEQIEQGLRLLEDMIKKYNDHKGGLSHQNIDVYAYIIRSGSSQVIDEYNANQINRKGLRIRIGEKTIRVELKVDGCGGDFRRLIESWPKSRALGLPDGSRKA